MVDYIRVKVRKLKFSSQMHIKKPLKQQKNWLGAKQHELNAYDEIEIWTLVDEIDKREMGLQSQTK